MTHKSEDYKISAVEVNTYKWSRQIADFNFDTIIGVNFVMCNYSCKLLFSIFVIIYW